MTVHSPIDPGGAVCASFTNVAALISLALASGDFTDWQSVKQTLENDLNDEQQATLAFFALRALPSTLAEWVVEASFDCGAGQPIPTLLGFMDEAAFWADRAEPEELEAYCLACFRAMSPHRRAAFLAYVSKGGK